jgi:hypothetical protein
VGRGGVGVQRDDLVEDQEQRDVVALFRRADRQRRCGLVLRRDELRRDVGRDDHQEDDDEDQQLSLPEHSQEIVERHSSL